MSLVRRTYGGYRLGDYAYGLYRHRSGISSAIKAGARIVRGVKSALSARRSAKTSGYKVRSKRRRIRYKRRHYRRRRYGRRKDRRLTRYHPMREVETITGQWTKDYILGPNDVTSGQIGKTGDGGHNIAILMYMNDLGDLSVPALNHGFQYVRLLFIKQGLSSTSTNVNDNNHVNANVTGVRWRIYGFKVNVTLEYVVQPVTNPGELTLNDVVYAQLNTTQDNIQVRKILYLKRDQRPDSPNATPVGVPASETTDAPYILDSRDVVFLQNYRAKYNATHDGRYKIIKDRYKSYSGIKQYSFNLRMPNYYQRRSLYYIRPPWGLEEQEDPPKDTLSPDYRILLLINAPKVAIAGGFYSYLRVRLNWTGKVLDCV